MMGLEIFTLNLPDGLFALAPELLLAGFAMLVLLTGAFLQERDPALKVSFALTVLALMLDVALQWVQGFGGGALAPFTDISEAHFKGQFISDTLSSLVKGAAALALLVALGYSRSFARARGFWNGEFLALALLSLLGIHVLASAGHLLLAYLGIELLALPLYAIAALQRESARGSEAAMKYFALGALASALLLFGFAMIYGATGTLTLSEIATRSVTANAGARALLLLGLVFMLCGLAFKFGAVPFHMWVPDVYEGAPTPAVLVIATAPKLAVLALTLRLLPGTLPSLAQHWQMMLALLAALSLLLGNGLALAQSHFKRMLGYSAIGQMGFLLLALTAGWHEVGWKLSGENAATAHGAALVYALTYILTMLAIFGALMALTQAGGQSKGEENPAPERIAALSGLNQTQPLLAGVLALGMFSLAGIPPLVGFAAKLAVLRALLAGGEVWLLMLALYALLMSLIAAFYYLRVVKVMYFDDPTNSSTGTMPTLPLTPLMRAALALNGALLLLLGLFPGLLFDLAQAAVQAL